MGACALCHCIQLFLQTSLAKRLTVFDSMSSVIRTVVLEKLGFGYRLASSLFLVPFPFLLPCRLETLPNVIGGQSTLTAVSGREASTRSIEVN